MKSRTLYTMMALTVMSFLLCISCQESQHQRDLAIQEQLRAQLVLYIDSCWNKQDSKLLGQLATSGFIRHLNGIRVAKSANEMEAHMKVFFSAFPDLEISITETDITGSKIFVLWQATGTNTGIYGEVAATGKKVKINGMSQLYFDEIGKLYREDVYFNELDLLQQLGYTLTFPNLE
ncbi:MAG: ester cyclase [Flavobacteriaceae bacterium]